MSTEAKSELLNQETFEIQDGQFLTIIHKKIPLHLRTVFGTSHSSTTVRYNSFIQIIISKDKNINDSKNINFYGLGESGLPPKKPGCYLADCNDICEYIKEYFKNLKNVLKDSKDALQKSKENLNQIFKEGILLPDYIYCLFYALDSCPANTQVYSKASKNCIEGAIMDLCGKISKLPLYDLLKIKYSEKKPSFYTVSISGREEMEKSIELGLKYTHCIKIKLNHDLEYAKETLKYLNDKCTEHEKGKDFKCLWSLDLNSDFENPDDCIKMINEVLINYKTRIYMVEQPFPQSFEKISKNFEGWKKVKNLCEENNMLLYADESASTVDSIEPLKEIVSGVNIKLEKCGGIREGLKCVKKANELGLKIWIGCMVGSNVLMNIAAGLTLLSTYSDLDGFLLVTEESQPGQNGFIWNSEKGYIELSKENGIGVTLKSKNNLI